jgi:uncharacterized oligopeptide transporter (OPT) family protein
MLGAIALIVLGPICGVTCAYMTFSLGFMIASQVLAGILGSTITYGYGAEGKHGANYMQTMAASVGSMSGLGVLVQAMVWLGMPLPPSWALMLYMGCIGMFGVGVGMLFTPILVDHLQLEYPSGHAVANILRALTDVRLLRRSVAKLGSGTALGLVIPAVVPRVEWLKDHDFAAATIGAGMIVNSRIAVPVLVLGGAGYALQDHLRAIGWLGPQDPFRKVGFLVGLALIMGAAVVDLVVIGAEAVRRVRARAGAGTGPGVDLARGGLGAGRLVVWVMFWAAALVLVGTRVLHQPPGYLLFAIGLSFVFVFVNGISYGISDNNPISSAFVVCVLAMSAIGLRDPVVGMLAAGVLLVSCTVGGDMQQDRSTGWRLKSNRAIQFRYQAGGIALGAVLSVALAQLFMRSYPVLRLDGFAHPEVRSGPWQSAMTFKFVGAIRDIGHLAPHKVKALLIGLGLGFALEVIRKLLGRSARYRAFRGSGRAGFATGWLLDAVLLPSPYALSFGGFFDLPTSFWFACGGVLTSVIGWISARPPAAQHPPAEAGDVLPEDMSTSSLIGGGLIAGESLYTLGAGVASLLSLRR